MPSERAEALEHIDYLRTCIQSGLIGQVRETDDETRQMYESWLEDEDILIRQVLYELDDERRTESAAKSEDPLAEFIGPFVGPLPPIHLYRTPYDVGISSKTINDIPKEQRALVRKRVTERKRKLRAALRNGTDDGRRPLDPGRRAWFEETVKSFNVDDHPESIPETFQDGSCNIFGHICPVFLPPKRALRQAQKGDAAVTYHSLSK